MVYVASAGERGGGAAVGDGSAVGKGSGVNDGNGVTVGPVDSSTAAGDGVGDWTAVPPQLDRNKENRIMIARIVLILLFIF
jgi:hypothetical protein